MYDDDRMWNTFGRRRTPDFSNQDFREMEWKTGPMEYNEYIKELNDSKESSVDPVKSKGLKHDQGKLLFECLMGELAPVLKGVVRVLTYGAQKYSRSSWKNVPNAQQRYTDAFYRHMNEYHSGSHVDDESGLPHLFHALCNLMFITWFEIQKTPYIFTREKSSD